MVVVRKKENISTEEFRRVWKEEYGPYYTKMPEVKSYIQYHLDDRRKDNAEDPIDGITILSFESEESMNNAWKTEIYKEGAKVREKIMRETAIGVHVASVAETITLV